MDGLLHVVKGKQSVFLISLFTTCAAIQSNNTSTVIFISRMISCGVVEKPNNHHHVNVLWSCYEAPFSRCYECVHWSWLAHRWKLDTLQYCRGGSVASWCILKGLGLPLSEKLHCWTVHLEHKWRMWHSAFVDCCVYLWWRHKKMSETAVVYVGMICCTLMLCDYKQWWFSQLETSHNEGKKKRKQIIIQF